MARYKVALFGSTQRAIRGEKIMKEAGLAAAAIPVPRNISSDCGIVIRFPSEQTDEVVRVLRDRDLEPKAIHNLER